MMKSKLWNILLLDIPLLSYSFAGARTKGQDFNQIFYQPTETIITALTVSKLKVEKEFLSLTKK